MNSRHISQCLALVTFFAVTTPLPRAQDAPAQRISPARNWGLAFTGYSQFREDYDSMPLRVEGIRGGKLSPNEKFKIEVTVLSNHSNKSVSGAEFTWYLFDNTDRDKVFDSGTTPLIELTISPRADQKREILVVNIEDIPFLKNNPRGTFLLEVGVAKVAFSDGTTWEAGVTPGKFDYAKVLQRSRQ